MDETTEHTPPTPEENALAPVPLPGRTEVNAYEFEDASWIRVTQITPAGTSHLFYTPEAAKNFAQALGSIADKLLAEMGGPRLVVPGLILPKTTIETNGGKLRG